MDSFSEFEPIASVLCEVFNSAFTPLVGFCGYMNRDNFMEFAKHFMAIVNSRRIETILKQKNTGGRKYMEMCQLNKIISERMATFVDESHRPCSKSKPCILCK